MVAFGFPRDKAEDLAQTTFVRVYEAMDQYRGEAEWSFLKKTALRVALNELRKGKAIKRAAEEISVEALSSSSEILNRDLWTDQTPPSPEQNLIEQEEATRLGRRLRAALASLPQGLRDCLGLRLRGLKYRQIAERMDISMDTVKSRLHEARNQLRDSLAEEPEGIAWSAAPGEDDDDQEK